MYQINSNLSRLMGCALVILASWGCADGESALNASFDMPTGLTVAGTTGQRLFIANTGEATLQVMELGTDLTTIDPIKGPSYYFPLRIPGGPAPEEITSTEDGRFVVILNWVTHKLHVIDADTLDAAFKDGTEVEVDLGSENGNPYRIISAPGGCAQANTANCSGHILVSFPTTGKITHWAILDNPDGPQVELLATYTLDGAPGEMTASSNAGFIFAADTLTGHIHRIETATSTIDKWNIGSPAVTLSASTNDQYLVVGRKGIQDALILDGATTDTLSVVAANPSFTPGTRCLPDCNSELSAAEQCPGAHPADLAICQGESGIEVSAAGSYPGIYLGFIPAAITALGTDAGHPAISVPCQSIADEPLEQIWSEVAFVQGQNGQGYFIGLTLESGEDITPTILSEGWCRGPSMSDSALETYETSLDEPTLTLDEPLLFNEVFAPCGQLPDLNRFSCVTPDDGEAGVVLNPVRSRVSLISYEWEPIVRLSSTGQEFTRDITGGIYKVEDDLALFADAGISIGSFAPYFKTRRQLAEQGKCGEDSDNCGDILEITYAIGAVQTASSSTVDGTTATTTTTTAECLEALAEEPAHGCSLERRIIDTRSINGTTELILDRPLPEACLPESGRITYRVRMGDVYGVTPLGGGAERMAPGDVMGLGGSVLPTGAITAKVKAADSDLRTLGACERYGDQGVFLDSRYQRDTRGEFRVYDAHAETLSNGNVVGLTWTLMNTTSGEALSPAGAPMLLGQSTMWLPENGLPVIFSSYARSNRVVGLVPYPYTADPDDAYDFDAPFLSNSWRDTATHFTELN